MSKEQSIEQRPFAAFDIDGTLIRWQLYHATVDKLVRMGHVNEKEFEPVRSARMAWKNREQDASFKEYEHQLVDFYSRLISTLTVDQVNGAIKEVFEEYKDQASTFTRELIQKRKSEGYLLFAISGSQTEIVSLIAEHYGFDDFVGSTYVNDGTHFTGEVILPIGQKDRVLNELIEKHKASRIGSVAVGDSTSDVAMLEVVENPIAFNPEANLAAHAIEAGWKIVLERKNVVWEMEEQDGQYILVKTNI